MKALLIKYLPATDTLDTRFKVTIEGSKPFTLSTHSNLLDVNSHECLEMQAAKLALDKWDISYSTLQIGQLPNLTHVVTIGEKDNTFHTVDFNGMYGTDVFIVHGDYLSVKKWADEKEVYEGYFSNVITRKTGSGIDKGVTYSLIKKY